MTLWVVGTLSVMGPCWCPEQIHLLFFVICILALSPALPMDPGEQVQPKFILTPASFAGGALQEFHHRQRLHPDLLLASLPTQLPTRHHLHKVSRCPLDDCNFPRVITAEYGYFVRIDFRDLFRIEPASNDGKCAYDYLEVSQMNEESSSRCRVQIPWPILHAA